MIKETNINKKIDILIINSLFLLLKNLKNKNNPIIKNTVLCINE